MEIFTTADTQNIIKSVHTITKTTGGITDISHENGPTFIYFCALLEWKTQHAIV